MKVVTTLRSAVDRASVGGIVHFFLAAKPWFTGDVRYFTVGNRRPDVRSFGVKEFWRVLGDYLGFWRACADVDLVHLNPSLAPGPLLRDSVFVLIARIRAKPLVVFHHGWQDQLARQISGVYRRVYLATYGRSDACLVLSERFAEQLRSWGYRGPVTVMSTCVDDSLLDNVDVRELVLHREKKERVDLLFLASLTKAKGADDALSLFKVLLDQYPNSRLRIAGDGPERHRLEERIRREGIPNVEMLGYVTGEAKRRAFIDSDIYLFPSSHNEGLPTSVLEAMTLGLPVIATPRGGIPDVVQHGVHGYLVKDASIESMLEPILKLIGNSKLRRRMSLDNHAYARDRFLASAVVRRLEGVYHQAVSSHSADVRGAPPT